MVGCNATVRRTGMRCGCRVNGPGNFCGRHGGFSRARYLELIQLSPQGFDDLIEELSNLRVDLIEEQSNLRVVDSNLEIEKEFIELDIINKFYCGICMEDVDSENAGCQLKCCKKGACKDCLQNWMYQSNTCPYCRTSMS